MHHRQRRLRLLSLELGPQEVADLRRHHVFHLGIRLDGARVPLLRARSGQLSAAHRLQHLPRDRRRGRGPCVGHLPDVHRRGGPVEHPRHPRVVEPVRNHLRPISSLHGQLPHPRRPHQPRNRVDRPGRQRRCARQRPMDHIDRLALHVRQRGRPGRTVRHTDMLRARNSALSRNGRTGL